MSGLYFEPTILECPRQGLRIVDTELFGPVLCVQRFKTEDEVIALANDTEHGLAAGIFTRDSARSLRMADAVRAGIVWGEYIPCGFAHRRVRRGQRLGLWARKRISGDVRLHASQDGVDEHLGRTNSQSICDALRKDNP